ncbi:beta-sandwich lipoprotein [Streptococcus lutetiensis]|uniref:beta-sandwich lipoprotein n=1 Tax=Streptococcus lutetiensis TaxID=150055 RepID=UPI0035657B4B
MKNKKIAALAGAALMTIGLATLSGCSTESEKVSYNISKEADNFNVRRRVAVINTRTDKIEFKVEGLISVDTSNSKKLVVIAEVSKGKYRKHLINMTKNNMYVVEDLTDGTKVNKYKYEVEYMPESILPVTITNNE